jgi:hypothetical protein
VVCIPNSSGGSNSFGDGTLQDDASALLTGMEEILAKDAEIAGNACAPARRCG